MCHLWLILEKADLSKEVCGLIFKLLQCVLRTTLLKSLNKLQPMQNAANKLFLGVASVTMIHYSYINYISCQFNSRYNSRILDLIYLFYLFIFRIFLTAHLPQNVWGNMHERLPFLYVLPPKLSNDWCWQWINLNCKLLINLSVESLNKYYTGHPHHRPN